MFICDKGTGAQQLSGLVMSEIHRRRTPTSLTVKNFEFSFVGNDRRPPLFLLGRLRYSATATI